MPKRALKVHTAHIAVRRGYCGGSPVIAGTKLPARSVACGRAWPPENWSPSSATSRWRKSMVRSRITTTIKERLTET